MHSEKYHIKGDTEENYVKVKIQMLEYVYPSKLRSDIGQGNP